MVVGSNNRGCLVGKLANNTTCRFSIKSSYVWGIDVFWFCFVFLNLNYGLPGLDDLSNRIRRIAGNRVPKK